MKKILLLMFTAFVLAACSADEKTEKPAGILTETQTKALEQSKAVEDTLKKAEEDRRKALDAAEQ